MDVTNILASDSQSMTLGTAWNTHLELHYLEIILHQTGLALPYCAIIIYKRRKGGWLVTMQMIHSLVVWARGHRGNRWQVPSPAVAAVASTISTISSSGYRKLSENFPALSKESSNLFWHRCLTIHFHAHNWSKAGCKWRRRWIYSFMSPPSSFSSPRRTKSSETKQRKAGNIGKMLLLSTEEEQMATESQPILRLRENCYG